MGRQSYYFRTASRLGIIHPLAQFLAGFEVRYVLRRYLNLVAGLGVAPQARWTIVQSKTAETTDLDTSAVRQGRRHAIKDHFHGQLCILAEQLCVTLRELGDKI